MTTSGHITHHTASEAAGTGADITHHGTGIHGLTVLGVITDFTIRGITEAGMEDGMTHGITADGTVAFMTRGTTAAGTALGVIIMQDGTVDGIPTGTDITIILQLTKQTDGEAAGIRPDPTVYSQAEAAHGPDSAHRPERHEIWQMHPHPAYQGLIQPA